MSKQINSTNNQSKNNKRKPPIQQRFLSLYGVVLWILALKIIPHSQPLITYSILLSKSQFPFGILPIHHEKWRLRRHSVIDECRNSLSGFYLFTTKPKTKGDKNEMGSRNSLSGFYLFTTFSICRWQAAITRLSQFPFGILPIHHAP